MERNAAFQKRLLATFTIEAQEHLKGITDALIALEQGGAPQPQEEVVETMFRETHSLKGAARAVTRSDIESVCQALEGVFAALKRGEMKPSPELFDLMQRARDFLARLLLGPEPPEGEGESRRQIIDALVQVARRSAAGAPATESAARESASAGSTTEEMTARETAALPDHERPFVHRRAAGETPGREPAGAETAGGAPALGGPPAPDAGAALGPGGAAEPAAAPRVTVPTLPAVEETVRVATAKLASLLLLSEEMLSAKLSATQHVVQMRELRSSFATWRREWSRMIPELQTAGLPLRRAAAAEAGAFSGEEARALQKVLEFLEWNGTFQKTLEGRSAAYLKSAERDNRMLGGLIDNLLDEVKKVMMFPFSTLLEAFPKVVRDLARDHGKEVDLLLRGEELEIDRRVLEEMKDPLLHLVRNCISHGIELPQERERKRKSRRGKLSISITPREGRAEVVVSDDGAGIDAALLRSTLTRLGLLPPEKSAEMSDAELLPFVFQSGVSTSPIVTEISGRGLGLAIVREKVEKLGGSISFESDPERGTLFRIVLPLSVATFRGLLVRVADRLFVLPAIHVERAVRAKRDEVATVQSREIIDLNGRSIALARLADVLELYAENLPSEQLQAVVVTVGDQSVAFVVDEVLNEREVLMKRMGPQLSRLRNIAGATLLGSGKLVPILNVPDLIKSATRGAPGPGALAPPAAQVAQQARRILVVEDSITSRTLMKNILESAGYLVATAVDGMDALTQLKNDQFDLVVSDVDMPRLNGFDLTARIRADRDLAELPVVLVTALGSREDRERGVEVGANAYIVKGSFDQSDLLKTVQRLV